MKVKDFDVEYGGGVFSCCFDHVMECDDPCEEGDIIECQHCGVQLILTMCGDRLKWKAY